ncbi:hypothetical protein B7463_g12289, partial [Scytalidium lignicola]
MTNQQTAKTQSIEANGTKFAYRLFGLTNGTPLVFLQHFRGTMDHWDPALINPLAKTRPIFLIDNSGVGKSSGQVPDTFGEWAANIVAVVKALSINEIDLLGFSMGGMVAQLVALDYPGLVRRLILAGTGPSVGEGLEQAPEWAFKTLATASSEEENESGFLKTFYSLTDEKQTLGKTWWERINEKTEDRSDYVGPEGTQHQINSIMHWMTPGNSPHSYDRLGDLRIPVFVAADILVPTENSIMLWK